MYVPVLSILVFLAALVPVAGALLLAYHQSVAAEQARARSLAQEALRRSDAARSQILHAFRQLGNPPADSCSVANRARLASAMLQYVAIKDAGYIRGDRIICTSTGMLPRPVPLSSTFLRTHEGVQIRIGVGLPFAPGLGLVMVSLDNGYALLLHPFPSNIDVPIDDKREGVAQVATANHSVITSRGVITAAAVEPFFRAGRTEYIVENKIVAAAPSRLGDYVVFATLPKPGLMGGIRKNLLFLLPLGIGCGILLLFLLRLAVRLESSFAAMFKRALRSDQLSLHYQPIVELRSGRWVGAEALIRWRLPNGEEMRPDLFVPQLEEAGLVHLLTDKVFALLAKDISPDLREREDFYVSINVASPDLRGNRLPKLLERLVAESGCTPRNLAIEVTERGLIDAADGRPVLQAVRTLGVRVALDDFGTGYSSLSYLQKFPLDFIKIDKSFVDAVETEAATSSVVTHIIHMAHDLKLGLIAEGVETDAQQDFLRERGVAYGQGWKFAQAMPWPQLIAELTRREARTAQLRAVG